MGIGRATVISMIRHSPGGKEKYIVYGVPTFVANLVPSIKGMPVL